MPEQNKIVQSVASSELLTRAKLDENVEDELSQEDPDEQTVAALLDGDHVE